MAEAARILLIDDDPDLLDVLAMGLEDEGFVVDVASDGSDGLAAFIRLPPALVITDVNMPGIDGFTLCRKLRERGAQVPIIILTSRDHEIDEALGLELGADDYVSKPFNTRVLVARVRALLRRERLLTQPPTSHEAEAPVLRRGVMALSPDRLEVRLHDQALTLTVTEFKLIEALARRPGVVYSRQQLLDRVRGDDSVVAERIIDTYVRRLRRKFEQCAPGFDPIETVIGAGYRWSASYA